MKLTTLIMILFLLQVAAAGKAQITINANKAKLQAVLEKISEQSGYDFVYSDNDFKNTRAVNVKLNNATIERALEVCFANQPLSYQISEKTVIVKRKEEKGVIENLIGRFQTIDVRGRVVDQNGSPLPGATVKVKGSGKVVSTNANGEFYIPKVDEKEVLVFTYTGYLLKESNANSDLSTVQLELSNSKLDEVQVIAYGTTSQRFNTGNVTTIKAADIEKQPVQNPLLALEGRVPGLFISQSTGYAGSGVTVRIQGQNSINNGNDPLYVIDGVPYNSQLLPGLNNIMGVSAGQNDGGRNSTVGNPLNFINPSDIESIDILKDADATAIYGSRAANGAILITTKKGKKGELTLAANAQQGYSEIARKLKLLNAAQYQEIRKEAFKNSNLTPDPTVDYDMFDNYGWSTTRNTDWQEELVGKTAQYTNLQTTLTGGSDNVQFLAGGSFKRTTAAVAGDFKDITGVGNFSLNANSANRKFTFSLSGSFLSDKNELPTEDLMDVATKIVPGAPVLRNPDGSLNWAENDAGSTTWGTYTGNPLAKFENRYRNNTNNLLTNSILSYEIIPGLLIKSTFGYSLLNSKEISKGSLNAIAPELRANNRVGATFQNNISNSLIVEPQINYALNIFGVKFDALLGGTLQQNKDQSQSFFGNNYPTESSMDDLSLAASVEKRAASLESYKYNAVFARGNFNWKEKYIISLTGRRDGSSRFGENNKFHNFGSIAGAWIFTEEKIFSGLKNIWSFGKLRASIGTTGSDQIGNYRYLNNYDQSWSLPYQGISFLLPAGLSNKYIQWEETKKLQIGIDLGFFKDRILFNSTFVNNTSSNQLLDYRLPATAGFESIITNFPAKVGNSGWEFSITSTNFKNTNFKWTSGLNLTFMKNKLLEFEDLANSSYPGLLIGRPVSIIRVYNFLGVNPTTGLYEVISNDGIPTSNPVGDDHTSYYDSTPKYYGGFQNTISYKSLSLDFLFQFAKQDGNNLLKFGFYPGFFEQARGNQPITVLERWHKPGDNAPVQKVRANFTTEGLDAAQYSDAAFTDASYVRLKTVTLSWQLPDKIKQKAGLITSQIYIQGQNLWTISNYIGADPETRSSITLPPLRTITIGIRTGF